MSVFIANRIKYCCILYCSPPERFSCCPLFIVIAPLFFLYLLSEFYEDKGLEVEEDEEAILREGDEGEEVLFEAVDEVRDVLLRKEPWGYCRPFGIYLASYFRHSVSMVY